MDEMIYDVLRGLHPSDNRYTFWRQMEEHLAERKFDLAIEKLIAHNYDYDYGRQVQVVTNEIRRRLLDLHRT